MHNSSYIVLYRADVDGPLNHSGHDRGPFGQHQSHRVEILDVQFFNTLKCPEVPRRISEGTPLSLDRSRRHEAM